MDEPSRCDGGAARREDDLRLRSFFDLSNEAIGLARGGRHVMVSPAHARLFGYDTPEQLIGVPTLDLVAPEAREAFLRVRAGRGYGPCGDTYLTRGLRRDGTRFDLEVRVSSYMEESGEVLMAVLRDVTAQRERERELRESERRARELFDLVPVSLWEVDLSGALAVVKRLRAEGVADLRAHVGADPGLAAALMSTTRILDVNATGCAMVGARSREELLANLDKVWLAESFPAYLELTFQLAEGQRVVHLEAWSRTLDGGRKWIETTASIGPGAEQTWERILLSNVDATERRRSETRLRAFFQVANEAMGLAKDGRYLLVNPAFARLFAYDDPAEMVGLPTLGNFAESERPRIVDYARRRAAGEPLPPTYLSRGLRKDGTEFEAELRAFGFRDEGTQFTASVVRDVTESQRMERQLRESEHRYRELFDLLPISLFELDCSGMRRVVDRLRAEGVGDLRAHVATHPQIAAELVAGLRVVDVNRASCVAVGAASREDLLANLDRIVLSDSGRTFCELAFQLAEGRSGARIEAWHTTFTGERRLIETSSSLLPGHEADWGRVVNANLDITERRRSETRLQAIFDAAAEPMAFTLGGRFERVNAAFARTFGFASPGDAVGLSVGDLVLPSELARLQERHRRRQAGEPVPDSYTARCVRRDGAEFDVEVKTAGLREGDRVATVSILRDVTEQLAAERRLRESERRFRELFDFVPISLYEIDLSAARTALDALRARGVADLRAHTEAHPELGAELMKGFRVTGVNAAGLALVGAGSLEELLAARERIYLPESFPRYRELALQLLEGRTSVRIEGPLGRVDGSRRWLETLASVVPGSETSWRRILFASLDVTERRRAEEERTALHERLRESEKLEAVGRLAGGIAHDFNNVLAAILSYAELTSLELPPGTELHEHQLRIREAALRARALVRQILTFSRRDTSNQRVVDVPSVVNEALSLMRAGIPSTVALETRIDPGAGATLADPTQIHQIVLNLCANARDAVGTYGRIEVELSPVEVGDAIHGLSPGPYLRLRVRDDGVGMDEATQARIFEPYMTTKGPFGGHGLGLPVVHGIVAGAGGGIRVDSAPGKGSTFDVYLPRHGAPAEPPATAGRTAPGHGERILLVDDEPLVRKAVRRQLESLGYVVEVVEDGQQALERFRASPDAFDLVVTDQTMPNLAGADLARALLALRPGLPIVLCTGYSDRIDEAGASALGLKALLMKPVDRETMATVLREALGR